MDREKIIAQREAFRDGVLAAENADRERGGFVRVCEEVKKRYPLPLIVTLRVVKDKNGTEWKYDGDTLYFKSQGAWWVAGLWVPDSKAVADVLTKPTESQEDTGE